MNYERIYNQLIERAKNRSIEGYIERHHIIPKCMGGTDDLTNLVDLTPEEHFVAHQLLVKMFPENPSLVYAAQMMCVSSRDATRNNKRYGWLKRKFSKICKQRIGEKNGATGSFWITDGVMETKVYSPYSVPEGFALGRINKPPVKMKVHKPNSVCVKCGVDTGTSNKKFCEEHFIIDRNNRIKNTRSDSKKTYADKFFITNGVKDCLHKNGTPIPEGFRKGRSQNNKRKID